MSRGDLRDEVGIQATFALTPIQKGLLAESLVASNKGQNVEQVVWELDHVPNAAAFRAAWQSALDAFDALRLRFEWPKSREAPTQAVEHRAQVPFRELDYSKSELHDHQARIEHFLEQDRSAGLDLMSVPLMRVALLILGPARAVCVWTIHHSIVDGWSYALVLQKVFESYAGARKGREAAPGATPEFTHFLRWVADHDIQSGTRHFAEVLRDFGEPTPLPLQKDAGRPVQSRSTRTGLRLDARVSDRLKAIARETATTPNAIIQLAWALLLSGYSGETDVVFGATWSGRSGTIERAAEVVGPFISTLPVRVNLTEAGTLRELLAALRKQHLAMRPFLQTPLSEIKASSGLARAAHLFPTIVVFDYESVQAQLEKRDERWRLQRIWSRSQTGYPLVLAARFERALELELEFDLGLYSADDAAQLLSDYCRLLTGIGDHLDERPFALSMFDADLYAALTTGEAAREATPRHALAITRILARAQAHPARIAVREVDGQEITYEELERRVLLLSGRLREHGVEDGTLVGVWLPRSIDGVVAMLAVHAAGGAFVPLDPNDPMQRIEYVLRDSKLGLLLVDGQTRGRAAGVSVVELDVGELGSSSEAAFPRPASLAYVIYTSGSTGEPKGVCVPQSALANHLAAAMDLFKLTPDDRVLQFTTPTFDVALEELLPTLAAGATVVLRSDAMVGSARAFFDAVERERISVVNLPTAFWHQVVQAEQLGWPSCLRLVVTGGERASAQMHRKFRETDTRHVRWLNAYGPTETTITSTYYDDAEGDHGPEDVPIGRPLPGVSHFVLDAQMRLVPPGAAGHLYIGGAGLALGYLFRDELTAQRFVEHPWRAGARLYATGDRVRRTRAGNYVYVDRLDHQVKVRGFRVELGEVEAQLRRHPSVDEAAVVLRTPSSGESSLAAFVVANVATDEVSEKELLEHLAAALPAHMLPSRIDISSNLPTTLSGKVDRRALAERGWIQPPAAPSLADESDVTSRTLREIWAEVLGVPVTSSSASFFDLGGHSLLVVRMFSEVERRLGKTCNAAAFFRNPTISHLAELIRDAPESSRSGLVQLARGSARVQPLFFAPGLTGRAVDFVHLVQALADDVPVYALQLHAFQDAERPGETLADAVRDIVDLMQRVQRRGPYAIAGFSAGGVFAVAIAEELRTRSERMDFVGLIDCVPPASVPIPSPLTSPRRMFRLSKTVASRVQEILDRPNALPALWTRTRAAALRSVARWNLVELKYQPRIEELFGEIPVAFSKRDVKAMQRYLDAIVAHDLGRVAQDLVLFRTPLDPPEGPYEPDLGWRRVTSGRVTVEHVRGRHGDILTSSGCGELAEHLSSYLKRRPRGVA